MRTPRVLVSVESDPAIKRLLRLVLKKNGYQMVSATHSIQPLLETIAQQQPDLLILDTSTLCTPIRHQGMQMPIMIISERPMKQDIVRALDEGADDYIETPCGRDELAARIRALLRRTPVTPEPSLNALRTQDGHLTIYVEQHQAYIGEQEVRLTPTEFELLCLLMQNEGKVLTHRTLLHAVWGPEYGEESDYLRVYVRQLRRKIEPDPSRPRYILTEPSVGYTFHAAPRG